MICQIQLHYFQGQNQLSVILLKSYESLPFMTLCKVDARQLENVRFRSTMLDNQWLTDEHGASA
jgi:hypothetical protein